MAQVWPKRPSKSASLGDSPPDSPFPLPPSVLPPYTHTHTKTETGSPPFLQALPPLAAKPFPPPISRRWDAWGLDRETDFEEVKGASPRPSSNKWVALRGGTIIVFSGLRRGACQEDVEASRPPASPHREADRRQQLCGRRGALILGAECPSPPPPLVPLTSPPTPP